MSPGTTQKSVLLFQRREQPEEEEIGFSSRGHFSHLLHPFLKFKSGPSDFPLGKTKALDNFPNWGLFWSCRRRQLPFAPAPDFLFGVLSPPRLLFFPISEKSSIQEKTEGWIILVSTAWESIFSTIFPHTLTGKDQRRITMDISTYISKRKRIFKKKDVSGPFVRNSIIPYHERRVLSRISLPRSFPHYKNGEKGGKYTVSRGGWRIV